MPKNRTRLRTERAIQLEGQREDLRLKKARRRAVEQRTALVWITFVLIVLAVLMNTLGHSHIVAGSGIGGVGTGGIVALLKWLGPGQP